MRPFPYLLTLALTLSGCDSLWGAFRTPHGGLCGGERSCRGESFPVRPEVDLLFVIDNTAHMRSRQQNLLNSAPSFLEQLDAFDADYRLGVVSTDVGSWPEGGSFPPDRNCASFAGDDGLLQATPCTGRALSDEARSACATACPDPSFVPGGGVPWISRAGDRTNVPRAMEGGLDRGPVRALRCLAMLGDRGCELESPLEAARRALDGRNGAFLRPRSTLALVFMTTEDDCSVQAARRTENDPTARLECLNGSFDPDYRCFNPDFRCLARSVVCNEAIQKVGAKTGCRERDSYLEPVEGYARSLQGLRPDGHLAILGLWPPPLGTSGSRFEVVQETGANPLSSFDLNRAQGDMASCYNRTLGFDGQPQLRLSRFASLLPEQVIEGDVCARNINIDPRREDYFVGLMSLAARLRALSVRCLAFVPAREAGRPACVVGDVKKGSDGQAAGAPESPLPLCGAGCCAAWTAAALPLPQDPAIAAACAAEASDCYCAEPSTQAGVCAGGVVAAVWRASPPPEERLVNFTCAAP